MKKRLFALVCCLFMFVSNGQTPDKNKQYTPVAVGFWNIENFYDTLNDPLKNDEDFLPSGQYNWTGERYRAKMDRMTDVISQLGTESTPDGVAVMGLCEVENMNVLNDMVKAPRLAGRKYKIVHVEGPDARGVDVALLYNPKYFKVISYHAYKVTLVTEPGHPTRDELLVSGKLLGEDFHFIVCHWPSRRGGDAQSAPNRMGAARQARKIIDSLLETNPNAKIVLMGDLNDDPTDPSIREGLKTVGKEKDAKLPKLFNAMENHYKAGNGTLTFNNAWNLFDQQIMTPALVKGDFKDLQFYQSRIFNKPQVRQEEGAGAGGPFRTYVGQSYAGGYSDHFSVYSVFLKENVKK